MDKIDDRCLEFIGSKVQVLIQHGISVNLSNRVNINNKYGGTFCPSRKELKVAMGCGVYSVYAFIHEYAHFCQWQQNRTFWDTHFEQGTVPFMCWLDGFRESDVDGAFKSALKLEHDAEKIAIGMIRASKLPLCSRDYTVKANVNLLMYPFMRINRSWNNGHLHIRDDLVEPHIPKRLFTMKQLTDLKEMRKLFRQIAK
jgi:hypothetical protein